MAELKYDKDGRLLFTKEMKQEYTILMPQMLPVHFGMFRQLLILEGYKVDMLTTNHRGIVDEGLKYVHNDTCYPALLVIGQLIDAIKHGGYDPHKVALFITQTGGRLPGIQLYPPAAQGPGKGGSGIRPRHLGEPVRAGEKPRLFPHPAPGAQAHLRHAVRRPAGERRQPGPAL